MKISNRIYGYKNPATAKHKYNIGRVHHKRRNLDIALQYFSDAYELGLYFFDEKHILVRKIAKVIYEALGIDGEKQLRQRFIITARHLIETGFEMDYFRIGINNRIEYNRMWKKEQVNTVIEEEEETNHLTESQILQIREERKRIKEEKKKKFNNIFNLFSPSPQMIQGEIEEEIEEKIEESSDEPLKESSDEQDLGFCLFDQD